MTQYAVCLTGNAVISSALDVEWRKIFSQSVRRILSEQVIGNLIGNEAVVRLYVVADQTQHQLVYSVLRLLVDQLRTEKLLKQTLTRLFIFFISFDTENTLA